ncbi:MAG: signal peptide peptidase SppA [Chloroflexi bacterium]|nr:signal peptide peptidase SppA [Chloroflexota bacterium]
MRLLPLPRRGRIGLVELHGVIDGRLKTTRIIPLLAALRRQRYIKAVVLDIDSPGGGATASEYLHMSVSKLAAEKHVVAFIRGTGASGAYMAACGAQRIVATPGSIVGSIGVISLRPVAATLLQRVGIEFSVQKSGRLKDMGTFYRPPTEEEQRKLQELVGDFYRSFLDIVAQGRKMERERVAAYATGEVFTGRRALELGLVDELGDLERAIDLAAELSGAPRRVVLVQPRVPLRERLLRGMGSAMVESALDSLEEHLAFRLDLR